MRKLIVIVALGTGLSSSAQADSQAIEHQGDVATQTKVDFSGGFLTGQTRAGATDFGAEFSLRYHDQRGFYFGGLLSSGLLVDDRNVEQVDVGILGGGGLSLGLHSQVGSLRFHSGLRGEYLGVMDGNDMSIPDGRVLRGGPEMSAEILMGKLFGHPLSLEARASYLFYDQGDGRYDGSRLGLFLTGGLSRYQP